MGPLSSEPAFEGKMNGCYRFSLLQNDSYAFKGYPKLTGNQKIYQNLVPDFSGPDRSGIQRCEVCDELFSKWEIPLTGVAIKNHKYDLSVTYDGLMVVSEKFISVYTKGNLIGLGFRQLPEDPSFYAIHTMNRVEFDAEKRKTRFINPCKECGRYESVIGATPICLKASATIQAREFVFTDLEFGSGDEKCPLLICGPEAAEVILNSKLNGLNLFPIEAK